MVTEEKFSVLFRCDFSVAGGVGLDFRVWVGNTKLTRQKNTNFAVHKRTYNYRTYMYLYIQTSCTWKFSVYMYMYMMCVFFISGPVFTSSCHSSWKPGVQRFSYYSLGQRICRTSKSWNKLLFAIEFLVFLDEFGVYFLSRIDLCSKYPRL